MKQGKFLFIIIFSFAFPVRAQIVNTDFTDWKNAELQGKIEHATPHLIASLSRLGFDDSDTIRMTFNWRLEYWRVTHNVPEQKAKMLYGAVVLHIATLRTYIRGFGKLDNFRVFVRLKPGVYLHTDYEHPSVTPETG